MNRQALVGTFVILGLLGLFAIFFVLTDFNTRYRGYRIGVVFKSAEGLRPGKVVYESGVAVGTVSEIVLQPDFTVEVVLAIDPHFDIPSDARFSIQTPLAGDPFVVISPPTNLGQGPPPSPLPHEILPLDQQPHGTTPASIADLLEQGQRETNRLDHILASLETRTPRLLDTLQSTLENAQTLTVTGRQEAERLTARLDTLTGTLQSVMDQASGNVLDLTRRFDATYTRNSPHIDRLFASLDTTAHSLNDTVDQVRSLSKNQQLRGNLLTTTDRLADTATSIAAIARNMKDVTGNPRTKAELADTVSYVDATLQKANSILGQLGGTSSVYGVDAGATPPPGTTPVRLPPGAAPSPGPSPTFVPLRTRFANLTKGLVTTQVRVSGLSSEAARANTSPLLGHDEGPQTDFNLILLPNASQGLFLGANDIGTASTSYNFMLRKQPQRGTIVAGGVLYSRLGALASYDRGKLGVEGRAYDLRRPTFDVYGHINPAPALQIFAGERDITHSGRRAVLGVQGLVGF